jgi:NAD(P) transhydrogenase subunit alpha
MRPGSVVVDLAVAQGGNCFGTLPGQTVDRRGVQLIGADALPSSVPNHASALYARNLASLIEHIQSEGDAGGFRLDPEDPILDGCLLTLAGHCRRDDVVRPVAAVATPPTPAPTAAASS